MERRQQSVFAAQAARQTSTDYTQGNSWQWKFVTPAGKMLQGVVLDLIVTTAGAGMATTTMANLIQKFQCLNDSGVTTLDVDKYTIDLACLIGAATAWTNGYDSIPRTTDVCIDPANAATGVTAKYASYRLHAPLPGNTHLFTLVQNGILPTWTGATGGSVSASITPIWCDTITDGVTREQFTLFAKQKASNTSFKFNGAEMIAISNPSELTTVLSGADIGGSLTNEQILEYENFANQAMRGYGINGAGTAARTLVLQDPYTAADQYTLIKKIDGGYDCVISSSSSITIKAVVYGQRDTQQVPV